MMELLLNQQSSLVVAMVVCFSAFNKINLTFSLILKSYSNLFKRLVTLRFIYTHLVRLIWQGLQFYRQELVYVPKVLILC